MKLAPRRFLSSQKLSPSSNSPVSAKNLTSVADLRQACSRKYSALCAVSVHQATACVATRTLVLTPSYLEPELDMHQADRVLFATLVRCAEAATEVGQQGLRGSDRDAAVELMASDAADALLGAVQGRPEVADIPAGEWQEALTATRDLGTLAKHLEEAMGLRTPPKGVHLTAGYLGRAMVMDALGVLAYGHYRASASDQAQLLDLCKKLNMSGWEGIIKDSATIVRRLVVQSGYRLPRGVAQL